MHDITADLSAVVRVPEGGLQKMQVATFATDFDGLHRLGVVSSSLLGSQAGEANDPANIKLDSSKRLPATRKLS
jgi:hypothetical protein